MPKNLVCILASGPECLRLEGPIRVKDFWESDFLKNKLEQQRKYLVLIMVTKYKEYKRHSFSSNVAIFSIFDNVRFRTQKAANRGLLFV